MTPSVALANGVATSSPPPSIQPRERWGFPEFFVISQTLIPALLYFPGTQPFRLYIRIASFVISFATLLWWASAVAKGSRSHPAQPWIFAAMAYVVVMFFHPLTASTFAGLAQFVLYLSVIAPIFWAGTFVRTPERLARLMALLLICNGLNAVVGVLQVYDPGRWMPPEMSRVMTESVYGLGTVTYRGPDGRTIVRPPGLFDTPGAVAGPGMYAALLGLVFATSAIAWWKRVAALAGSFAGIAAIYLSQVRVSLVVSVLMLASYFSLLLMQERRSRAMVFGGAAVAIVIATFSFALVLGGESIAERTFTLFAQDPLALYAGSRGGQLSYTFGELLQKYPMGAGLGRWGMIAVYFGNSAKPGAEPLWVEIQVAGWAIDGGVALLLLYIGALVVTLMTDARVAGSHPDARVRACASVVLAANLGTAALIFTFTPFVTQIGLQFWFLAGALHGLVGVDRVRVARR
ncbi:MAG TPA: hypothetical protein VFT39_14475 [Vicinamibacterales bacterium]|nr:hypothetical protein [Vicinamibacterales bacterium]